MVKEKDQGKSKYMYVSPAERDGCNIYLFNLIFFLVPVSRSYIHNFVVEVHPNPVSGMATSYWLQEFPPEAVWVSIYKSASNWVVHVFTAELQTLNLAAPFLFTIFNLYVDHHQFSDWLTWCEVVEFSKPQTFKLATTHMIWLPFWKVFCTAE